MLKLRVGVKGERHAKLFVTLSLRVSEAFRWSQKHEPFDIVLGGGVNSPPASFSLVSHSCLISCSISLSLDPFVHTLLAHHSLYLHRLFFFFFFALVVFLRIAFAPRASLYLASLAGYAAAMRARVIASFLACAMVDTPSTTPGLARKP